MTQKAGQGRNTGEGEDTQESHGQWMRRGAEDDISLCFFPITPDPGLFLGAQLEGENLGWM